MDGPTPIGMRKMTDRERNTMRRLMGELHGSGFGPAADFGHMDTINGPMPVVENEPPAFDELRELAALAMEEARKERRRRNLRDLRRAAALLVGFALLVFLYLNRFGR